MFATFSLIVYIGYLVHRMETVPIPALRVLRVSFTLLMTVLNIPLTELLLTGLRCKNGVLMEFHSSTEIGCFSPIHLPIFILNLLGLLLLAPLILFGPLVVCVVLLCSFIRRIEE
jgi:hypothetical protein